METFLFISVILLAFIGGFVVGITVYLMLDKPNGTIYLEKNTDGDDRIRFYLDMEYDDISKHPKIVFSVKKLS